MGTYLLWLPVSNYQSNMSFTLCIAIYCFPCSNPKGYGEQHNIPRPVHFVRDGANTDHNVSIQDFGGKTGSATDLQLYEDLRVRLLTGSTFRPFPQYMATLILTLDCATKEVLNTLEKLQKGVTRIWIDSATAFQSHCEAV